MVERGWTRLIRHDSRGHRSRGVQSEGAIPEEVPMVLERPRRRRLVFPLSSETESLEGHVEDGEGNDRDGASEPGA